MTHVNALSDSQESELLDEATYRVLEREIDIQLPLLEEDMMEPDQKNNIVYLPLPPHQQDQHVNMPVLDVFPGRYNFQFILNQQGVSKHCVYSESLQKIFINMEQTLPLRFEWRPTIKGLYLRTTMVFSLDQYRSEPVLRCHNHIAANHAGNNMVPSQVLKHVVRCLHPASYYEERGGHLSVIVPMGMPQAGSDYVLVNFQFFCKNSCTSGMNRRPTELVFTLEDEAGEVFGRQRLAVRVCSCPKRDKDKEEAEILGCIHMAGGKKRKLTAPAGKKLITPGTPDNREYNVNFKVPGRENYVAVLKYAYDLMAGQAMRTGQLDNVRPYMDDLAQKMQ